MSKTQLTEEQAACLREKSCSCQCPGLALLAGYVVDVETISWFLLIISNIGNQYSQVKIFLKILQSIYMENQVGCLLSG